MRKIIALLLITTALQGMEPKLRVDKTALTKHVLQRMDEITQFNPQARYNLLRDVNAILHPYQDSQEIDRYQKGLKNSERQFLTLCEQQDKSAVLAALTQKDDYETQQSGTLILNALYRLCNNRKLNAAAYAWLENLVTEENFCNYRQQDLDSTLVRACRLSCKAPVIRFAVAKGANVNQQIKTKTLLQRALEDFKCHRSCQACDDDPQHTVPIALLLEHGANPNLVRNRYGLTALCHAYQNYERPMQLLLAAGADMHQEYLDPFFPEIGKQTPFLAVALERGLSYRMVGPGKKRSTLPLFLEYIHKQDKNGRTMLHHLLQYLLVDGTPLFDGETYCNSLQALLAAGAKIDTPDNTGVTPAFLFSKAYPTMVQTPCLTEPKTRELLEMIRNEFTALELLTSPTKNPNLYLSKLPAEILLEIGKYYNNSAIS